MRPILFYIYKLPIGPYGLLLAAGLICAVAVAIWRGRRVGVKEETILDVAFFGVLAGIVGGRVGFILTHLPEFIDDPLPILFDRAGFQFLGGLILGSLAAIWVIRRHGARIALVADVAMPSVALGHAIGRLGCFCAGCCYGKVCHPPWEWVGVQFPRFYDKFGNYAGSPAIFDHIEADLIPANATESLPVWPTQLIEATGLLLVFAFLMLAWRRRRFEGQIFLLYLFAYGALRFADEFLRGDADRGVLLGLSTSQWISIGGIVLGIVLWRGMSRRPMPEPAMIEEAEEVEEPDEPQPEAPKGKRRRKRH